jgi:hypothetical protein
MSDETTATPVKRTRKTPEPVAPQAPKSEGAPPGFAPTKTPGIYVRSL